MFQFALPQRAFIELRFHRLARLGVRKAAHEKEGVRILYRKKRAEYFHADFLVCRNRLGAEYLKEMGALARLGFIRAHLNDHWLLLSCWICGAQRASVFRPCVRGNPVYFPRFAAIIRECLFKMAGIRGNVRDNESNKDGSAIQCFLVEKLTATILELADRRLAQ